MASPDPAGGDLMEDLGGLGPLPTPFLGDPTTLGRGVKHHLRVRKCTTFW